MEILYVCHRFPYPPKRGGKIRPFNMIRHLSRRHNVTVASLVRSPEEEQDGRGLRDYARDILVGRVSEPWQSLRMVGRLPSRVPSSMGYFFSPELKAAIRRTCSQKRFDLAFVHCSSVAQYVADVSGIPKILDFGDMDSQKWKIYSRFKPWPLSLGYLIEGTKLELEERRLSARFDLCTCTTRNELETLRSYDTGTDSDWFPNGVDADFFSPDGTEYDPNLISFIGRMDYFPNQQCMFDFCDNVLPLLLRQRPLTRLTIVGANPSKPVQRLAERPAVTVTGSVPDVRPYVLRSAAMVAPLSIARGTQNKILEAMAMGVPTVTTPVAAGGVDAVPGEHFLASSEPAEFAEAVLQILDHPEKRAELSRKGRERMLSHHDWNKSMERMDHIIDRCLDRFDEKAHSLLKTQQRSA